jgi:hypothetical protein
MIETHCCGKRFWIILLPLETLMSHFTLFFNCRIEGRNDQIVFSQISQILKNEACNHLLK